VLVLNFTNVGSDIHLLGLLWLGLIVSFRIYAGFVLWAGAVSLVGSSYITDWFLN